MKLNRTMASNPIKIGNVFVPITFPFATEYSVIPHELNVNRDVSFTKLKSGLPTVTMESRMITNPK